VYDLLIEPGELATPQKPVAVIGSASDLYLEMEVDEFDIRRIKPGQHVFVTLDSYGGQAFEAEVTRVIPLMNERSRTFKVEARFTKRPPQLFPNLTVEASIVIRTKENALLVPASYIVDGTYVLTDGDEKTLVKLGAHDMEKVEVLEGITANTTLYKP
jgi:multidrug efflux pump subunit AcrA (membrane-fusion protein)